MMAVFGVVAKVPFHLPGIYGLATMPAFAGAYRCVRCRLRIEMRIYLCSHTYRAKRLKTELSTRELAVLTLAAHGCTDDMVASELGIQCGTVNSYWVRIRGKLGNLSRSELVARFVQKNADTMHADYVSGNEVEAATLADENKKILALANAEIERLKELLAKRQP